jgi:D-alanyl-D-alanine carboxypeptidase
MNLKRVILGPLLSFVFLSVFTYVIAVEQWIFNYSLGNISVAVENIELKIPEPSKLEINAKSAIAAESNLYGINKIIFEKDSDNPLPIASLTKLMTAAVVLDNYNPSEIITVSQQADLNIAVKQDIKAGDVLSAKALLQIMIVGSSNKAASALSEQFSQEKFVDLMNEKARSLGLVNTIFVDSTGLSPQNVSTAKDLLKLAEYVIRNYPELAEISRIKELYVSGVGLIVNTNQILGSFPEVVCSKTGFTAAAKGCLLLVTSNLKSGDYLINIILGADDRFSEMEKLVNWSNETCN